MITSAYWLVPGANPYPANTPVWSVLTSLALSLCGTCLWKAWEIGASLHTADQFLLKADCAVADKRARGEAASGEGLETPFGDAADDEPRAAAQTEALPIETRVPAAAAVAEEEEAGENVALAATTAVA